MSGDPDAEAVARALAGDAQAFSGLVHRLQVRVFRFIYRQVGVESDAEDLAQETFIEAFRKLDSFQGNSLFSTWLLGIARNLSRNHINRSPSFRIRTTSDSVLDQAPDHQPGPHQRFEGEARLDALREGMASLLTPDLREALSLVSLEGMSYQEAAQLCDVPVGTMKTRVFRARKLLRDGLEEQGKLELFLS